MKAILYRTILPPLLAMIFRLWCLTWREKSLNPDIEKEIKENPGPGIYTFWHAQMLFMMYRFRGLNRFTLLVSPSKDGDLIANMAKRFGYGVIRASSYKKTVPGTRECLRSLKKGGKLVIIADGSRGPCQIAQAGSVQLARLTGALIYPLACDARPKYVFPSWDKFMLPLPFSKVTLNCAAPLTVNRDADEDEIQKKQDELTHQLNQISNSCQNH